MMWSCLHNIRKHFQVYWKVFAMWPLGYPAVVLASLILCLFTAPFLPPPWLCNNTWCHIFRITALVPWHVNKMLHHFISLQLLCPSWHTVLWKWIECAGYIPWNCSAQIWCLYILVLMDFQICNRCEVCYSDFCKCWWVVATHHREWQEVDLYMCSTYRKNFTMRTPEK
jgi:hypothetical protein